MLKLLSLWVVLPLLALASLAACSPTATLNALASSNTHSFTGGVAYGPLARQKLDIYQPTRDRKSTRLNSSHPRLSRMPSSA